MMRSNLHIGKVLSPALVAMMLLSLLSCGVSKSIHHQPKLDGYNSAVPVVKKITPTHFTSGNNFLLKNKQNLWELYVEGDPLERGLAFGSLSDSLFKKQENVFFSKIKDILPSERKQKMLRTFLKWYNRKVYLNVTEEYKTEIYGMSQYASHEFDYVAPPYLRSLYLHGAHDIGHALQDLALVGCSSFAAWADKSDDGSLILGRNFDFYAGDGFATDKIVAFVRPDTGYPFMSVTWAGMIGVVSGMNSEGLTVTLNAGKSKIPLVAKTPISILAREILQYSKNIDEAVAIAKKRKVFVSESIMIGSANDGKAVLIEVAPHDIGVYDVKNSDQLICTNHFQSDNLKDNKRNVDHIANSHSDYRYQRLTALLDENKKLNPENAVAILRNKDGLKNIALGYGNEKALNQLLAHHGIVFKPEQRLVWVSANPYQLGEFVCYDLNVIFGNKKIADSVISLSDNKHNIARDPFLETDAYKNYEQFRIRDREMDALLKKKTAVTETFAVDYQSLNPDYWVVYYKVGLAYYKQKDYRAGKVQFEKALTKEITTLPKKREIEKYLRKIKRKLQ
jgi:predicted choloylglycine hydrolase